MAAMGGSESRKSSSEPQRLGEVARRPEMAGQKPEEEEQAARRLAEETATSEIKVAHYRIKVLEVTKLADWEYVTKRGWMPFAGWPNA